MTALEIIHDKNGNVVQRSRNLRGIRRYVSTHAVKSLSIDRIPTTVTAWLSIVFQDGSTFKSYFADHGVLRDFVRRWRNVYGAPLLVNGMCCGAVGPKHPNLIDPAASPVVHYGR